MLVLCSDDLELLSLCSQELDHAPIKQVTDVRELRQQHLGPEDVIIFDLQHCPEEEISPLGCPALALTTSPATAQAVRLLRRGVQAYGNRYMHPQNIHQAIGAIRAGQIWLPPAMVSQLITAINEPKAVPEKKEAFTALLSKREEEVAGWVAQGLANREVADKMGITVRTVKAHLTSIFTKTGLRDRLELAVRLKTP